jgi:hypothetical protein
MKKGSAILGAALAGVLAAPALSQTPASGEFQVDTFTTSTPRHRKEREVRRRHACVS